MSEVRRAGGRRHWVELQSAPAVAGVTGFTQTWTTYASGWASIAPAAASPTERSVANTTQVPATHLVTVDYDARVQPKHRVLFGTRAFHIVGPPQNVDELDVTLVLSCEERAV